MILGIDHIGIAVHDASAATGVFADLIAHAGSHVEEVDGQAVQVAFVPETWHEASGTRLEILAPADPNDPSGAVARFLEKRGEGLHHVCFLTDDIDGEIARLAPRYAMVDKGPRRGHGGRVAFLHPRDVHGVLVELLERDAVAEQAHRAPSAPSTWGASMGAGLHVLPQVAPPRGDFDSAVWLLDAARAGDRRALARALTRVEAGGEAGRAVVASAQEATRSASDVATVIGITGAPGAGKSTLVAALANAWRDADPHALIAVLAIDPSSPTTGGAVLGDRVRMGALAGDRRVYVRSVAGRGAGDGLADAAWDMLSVLRAVGFRTIMLETVGSGQDAFAVAGLADTVVVVYAPGLGDSIQAMKSGVNDVADVIVVNKADLDGASAMASGLRFGRGEEAGCPVLETVATSGVGVLELRATILAAANRPTDREARTRRAIDRAATAMVRMRVRDALVSQDGSEIVRAVASGAMSPTDAAYVILGGATPHDLRR